MNEFAQMDGIAAPLPIANLDTDQIMPKQFLLGIDKSGLAEGLLYDLRCHADGTPRADFVLNRQPYRHAQILVGGANFGCGSSREHAVWGLQQWGIRVVLAPSFGEIFYYNSINNRLLTVTLTADQIEQIMAEVAIPDGSRLSIDVERQQVHTASGKVFDFILNMRQREMYLQGLDVVGASLRLLPQIEAFEQAHFAAHPWARVMSPRQLDSTAN